MTSPGHTAAVTLYSPDVTHVVLVRDAQLARHAQHAVPEHGVNGQRLARGLALRPAVIKQQILDIGAGASLKQRGLYILGTQDEFILQGSL